MTLLLLIKNINLISLSYTIREYNEKNILYLWTKIEFVRYSYIYDIVKFIIGFLNILICNLKKNDSFIV